MDYFIHLAILIAIYSILAVGLNLVVGFTGLLSVAHAAFYGIGAYSTALLMKDAGLNFFAAAGLSILIAAPISLAAGAMFSKFRGDYYALATLGFTVIVFSILINWQELTRGPLGIPGIPRPALFGISFTSNSSFLILSLAVAAAVYWFASVISKSSFGRALKGIREDENALQVFGYNTSFYKLTVFVISACIAAVAGALFAAYITFVDPTTFTVMESVFIIAVIILGGLASIPGSVIGAVVLILLPEALRFVGFPSGIAAQMRQVIYGVLLIVLMLYRPQGIRGEFRL